MISLVGLDSVMSSNGRIDNVESAIYLIRGQHVTLDADLSENLWNEHDATE